MPKTMEVASEVEAGDEVSVYLDCRQFRMEAFISQLCRFGRWGSELRVLELFLSRAALNRTLIAPYFL